jgi:hypothetical protein
LNEWGVYLRTIQQTLSRQDAKNAKKDPCFIVFRTLATFAPLRESQSFGVFSRQAAKNAKKDPYFIVFRTLAPFAPSRE